MVGIGGYSKVCSVQLWLTEGMGPEVQSGLNERSGKGFNHGSISVRGGGSNSIEGIVLDSGSVRAEGFESKLGPISVQGSGSN